MNKKDLATCIEKCCDAIIKERHYYSVDAYLEIMHLINDYEIHLLELPTKQEVQEFINEQPYYGHCTEEYNEGIKVGCEWMMNTIEQKKSLQHEIEPPYCDLCGQKLTEIRGRYPKDPRRKVCACCATEKLESIEEKRNEHANKNIE